MNRLMTPQEDLISLWAKLSKIRGNLVKSIIRYAAAFVFLFASHVSVAGKIAVVEPLESIANSNQGLEEQEKMKVALSKEETKGLAMQEELKSLMEKYQKDSAVMAPDALRNLEKDIEEKQLDMKFLSKKLQKRLQEDSKNIIEKLRPSFQQAMKNVVEAGGYDIVIQRQVVLDLGTSVDITAQISAEMNKKAAL